VRPTRSLLFPALLLALAGPLFLLRLSGRDLWEPNEPIAAQAAREMTVRGDWLLPTVNGEPYPDKPPLLFWLIRIASLPGGRVNETTARIPSALAGVVLVLAVYLLSRRVLGPRGALISAATLAVSNLFVEQARYVQHDMLLCLCVAVGILALFRVADGVEHRRTWSCLAALALGLGVLAKGPVALTLPALILVADTFLEPRIFRRWGYLFLAGFLALLPPILYYAALVRSHGTGLLATFIFHHNLDRFVSGFDHSHPWWFFLARSPIDLLPITFLLPAAAFLRPEDTDRRRFHRRLWLWILMPLAFFSLSASKRPIYVLPVLPAAALLCGSVLGELADGKASRRVRRLAVAGEAAALGLLGIAGAASPFLALRRVPELGPASFPLAFLAIAGSLLGISHLVRGRTSSAHGRLVATMAGVWLVVIFRIYPVVNAANTPRLFAEEVARTVPPGAPLKTFGLYRFRSGYLFYARRLMPRLDGRAALERFLESDQTVFCILPKTDFESVRASGGRPVYLVAEGRAGHRRDCLISNRPPARADPSARGFPGKDPASLGPGARSGSAF